MLFALTFCADFLQMQANVEQTMVELAAEGKEEAIPPSDAASPPSDAASPPTAAAAAAGAAAEGTPAAPAAPVGLMTLERLGGALSQ